MLTYNKTTQAPKLVIEYDSYMESPRKSDTNLGYFFTKQDKYKSPDGNVHELYEAMIEAESEAQDTESHIRAIKRIAEENEIDEKIIDIFPVYRYEHGNVDYRRGTAHGFDYSNCGFYIVTDKTLAEIGADRKDFEKIIDAELDNYTKWCNGEIYRFTLYDDNGKEIDACSGFYELEDIREYLGDEWKNENLTDYLI